MRTLKFFAFTFALGLSVSGFAGSKTELDLTYHIPIKRSSLTYYFFSYTKGACLQNVTGQLAKIEQDLGLSQSADQAKPSHDVQYECSEIVLMDSLVVSDGTGISQMTVYCKPRTLGEKQAYTMAKRCETQPTPECYSKEYLDYISAVPTMRRIQTFKIPELCGRK